MDRVIGVAVGILVIACSAFSAMFLMQVSAGEDPHHGGVPDPAASSPDTRAAMIKGFFSLPCETVPLISMCDVKVQLPGKTARGFVYPLGPANLVAVVTDEGMVGCGAFDVVALEKFHFPAARVRPSKGDAIASIEDLLEGIVKDANGPAQERGVRVGMTGKEALGKL